MLLKNKNALKGFTTLAVILIVFIIFAKPFNQKTAAPEVVCTMDAKQCADGTYVGRVAPFCEFAECPTGENAQKTTLTDVSLVKYTAYGFSPENITVKAGTPVSFQNNSNADFWPKSEVFDAATGIAPGNKFIYTFNTPGVWKFYNNLNSEDTGTIVVK